MPDRNGESAGDYIPTGGLALDCANSDLESVGSIADSNTDHPKTGMWVRAFIL